MTAKPRKRLRKRCRHRGRGCIFSRGGGRYMHWCYGCGALQKLKIGDAPTTLIADGKPYTITPGCSQKRYTEFWK